MGAKKLKDNDQILLSALNHEKAFLFIETCRNYLQKMIKGHDICLDDYFVPQTTTNDLTLQRIFLQLIHSAANASMLTNVIEFSTRKSKDRKDKILKALIKEDQLESFKYTDESFREYLTLFSKIDIDDCLQRLKQTPGILKGEGEVLWKQWLHSVRDAASFVLEFKSGDEFCQKFSKFESRFLFAGPILIKRRITGIGFALACDTLKGTSKN